MGEPTMSDIAAHLGVSRQLVSIVLRDIPGASPETRQRVREAAEELGYRPHIAARALALSQSRSRQIGVVFTPEHVNEHEIIAAMYPATAKHGLGVVLSAIVGTRGVREAVEELMGYRCAAIVVIGGDIAEVHLGVLARRARVPMVVLGAGDRHDVLDVVRPAGDKGIALMVRHLTDLGHQRVTYVDGTHWPPGPLRLVGYFRAMAEAGLPADVVTVHDSDFTEEAGVRAAQELLARPQLPTAVVAGNDQAAVGLMVALARAGVAVPADVSVTGFDDNRFARLSAISLTTVRQDPDRMGAAAIEALVRRIEDPELAPNLLVVDPTAVLRSSTAQPRRHL